MTSSFDYSAHFKQADGSQVEVATPGFVGDHERDGLGLSGMPMERGVSDVGMDSGLQPEGRKGDKVALYVTLVSGPCIQYDAEEFKLVYPPSRPLLG